MIQRYQQGCVEVLQLGERLTLEVVDQVRPELTSVLQERLPQVVIDLRRLRLVDSAGLELLCECQEDCLRRGGAVRLAGTSPLLREVMRVTGLDQEFAIHNDVISAAGAFAL